MSDEPVPVTTSVTPELVAQDPNTIATYCEMATGFMFGDTSHNVGMAIFDFSDASSGFARRTMFAGTRHDFLALRALINHSLDHLIAELVEIPKEGSHDERSSGQS